MGWTQAGRRCRWGAVVLVSLLLAACGGSDEVVLQPAPEPTALPANLSVNAPATRQALNADVAFSSSAADPERKLRYHWDFGDGNTSTAPAPTHRYARGGSYTVVLTMRNEAGTSVQASRVVTVADLALVQGLACSGADSGGWCWQNPLPQGNLINAQSWADERNGWAVGNGGAILKTRDGGASWVALRSGTQVPLTQVVAVSEQVAWVGGSGGLVLVTADGGLSWRQGSTGSFPIAWQGLRALDAASAWISGFGDPLFTTDGGQTWRKPGQPAGTTYSSQQTSPAQLWNRRSDNLGGTTLLRSDDAGATWQAVALPAPGPGLSQYLVGYRFADGQRGLVHIVESGYVNGTYVYLQQRFWTADGGTGWRLIAPSPLQPAGFTQDVQLLDDGSLFARIGYDARYERSADGGQTWSEVLPPRPSSSFVRGIVAGNPGQLLATIGGAGPIDQPYLSRDGGVTWHLLTPPAASSTLSEINSLWFFDSREGVALAGDGSSLRTSDGGLTWARSNRPVMPGYGWRELEFSADGSVGWAILDSGNVARSTDRGRTWLLPAPQSSPPLYMLQDVHFIDANRGWALVPTYSYMTPAEQLYTTTNGGMSWQAVAGATNLGSMRALRFADADHGLAVGVAGVAMVSSDGGLTWLARPTGSTRNMNDVTFIDAQTAVAVGDGGTILRSTDRGQTWVRVPGATGETLLHVRFVDALVGHATGGEGTVLVTRDGGLTWSEIAAPTPLSLWGSFFLDADTGWVVGQNGAILVTVSGGR